MKRRFTTGPEGSDELNISPLIDMVFILLIFFIVTTVFVEEAGVDISKPQAASAVDLDKNSIQIGITDTGKVVYNGREIGATGVRSTVRRLSQKEKMPVMILADKSVPTDLLVRVIDEATLGGALSTNVTTDPY